MFKRKNNFSSVDELRVGDVFRCYNDDYHIIKNFKIMAKCDELYLVKYPSGQIFQISKDDSLFIWFKELNSGG